MTVTVQNTALCKNKYNQFKKQNMQKPLAIANRVISISLVFQVVHYFDTNAVTPSSKILSKIPVPQGGIEALPNSQLLNSGTIRESIESELEDLPYLGSSQFKLQSSTKHVLLYTRTLIPSFFFLFILVSIQIAIDFTGRQFLATVHCLIGNSTNPPILWIG